MQVSNAVDAVAVVDVHVSHMHQTILDDVGSLVFYSGADAVVQLADDRH